MSSSNELNLQTERSADFVEKQDEFNYREFIGHLLDAKWTILAITGVVFFIAAFRAYTAVPMYQTDGLLLIEGQDNAIPGLAVMPSRGGGATIQDKLDTIKSRLIIGEAVDLLQKTYHIAPRYYPYIGSMLARHYHGKGLAEPLLGLDDYAWGGESLIVDGFNISGDPGASSSGWLIVAGENQEFTLMQGESEVLSGKVGETAVADYQGKKIEIHVSKLLAHPGVVFSFYRSSRIAAIKGLSSRIRVSQSGARSYQQSGMVTISMTGTNPQAIVKAVNAVMQAFVRYNREEQAAEAEKKLEFIDGQLPALKAKQDEAALELQKFQREAGSINITLEIENTLTKIEELRDELETLNLEKEELQQKFTEEHPMLKTISRKIRLTQKYEAKLEDQLRELPEKEWEFLQKSREVEATTELYRNLLQTAQELGVSKAGMTGNVRVIDPALIQPGMIGTSRGRTLILGLLFGLFLGAAWVLLKRMMHNGIDDPTRIERETGLPVFAIIPHSEKEEGNLRQISKPGMSKKDDEVKLLAFEDDTDLAIEALRSFRTNMRFTLKTSEDNVVIISGPSPGIGKSFFASNYAAVSCRDGQRVLLIDADMRKGKLHEVMRGKKSPGLSELIAGDVTQSQAIQEIKDDFFFLSCGKRPPNPSELLETGAFQRLLEEMNQNYDQVIIDTPPILAVTDASIIAQYGGKLFVLLRSGQHPMNEILAATSRFEKGGVKVTGILVNDQKIQSAGYGYSYQYHYK